MSKKGLGKFIAGVSVGTCLGILIAPKSGKETRKELREKGSELVDNIKNLDAKEIKEKLNQKLKEIKKELENLDKETALEAIKTGANNLMKKCDELIDGDKEACAPVIENAAKEVREKTITLLKGALDKLEKNEPKLKNNSNKKTKNA